MTRGGYNTEIVVVHADQTYYFVFKSFNKGNETDYQVSNNDSLKEILKEMWVIEAGALGGMRWSAADSPSRDDSWLSLILNVLVNGYRKKVLC